MPISVTGASRNRQRIGRGSRQGFTLVELLVVITVIGMAATAVVLSAPDTRPSITSEGERLAARLVMARDEAVLTNRSVAVTIGPSGYGFQTFDGVEWTALTGGLKASAWPEGINAVPMQRVVFDPTGASEPAKVRLSKDNRSVVLTIDGAGEVSLAS